ncbi:MAG: hypothetical protein L6276_06460, partial [Acetobacterium sp.]|nr:hypothetical protein [Bacillota bacterium]MCG2729912.1 hypothetical protein [Acetobacterium sp.]
MAVALKKIISALNGADIKTRINETSEDIEIQGYNRYTGQPEMLANHIYVTNASSMADASLMAKYHFIVIEDQLQPETTLANSPSKLIALSNDGDLAAVMTILENLFAEQRRIGECSIKFLQACQKGYTIQQLLDLGYQLLNNPLLLVDISLCFIAHSGGNNIENEPLWEWTLSKGYVDKEYARSVMTDDSTNEKEDGEEVLVIWETGLLNHRQLVGRVLKNKRPLAYLKLLEYHHPITDCDEEILIMLCNVLAMNMEDANAIVNASNSLSDTFLTALLNQKMYD